MSSNKDNDGGEENYKDSDKGRSFKGYGGHRSHHRRGKDFSETDEQQLTGWLRGSLGEYNNTVIKEALSEIPGLAPAYDDVAELKGQFNAALEFFGPHLFWHVMHRL